MDANTSVEITEMGRCFERFVDHRAGQTVVIALFTCVEAVKNFSELILLVQDLHLTTKLDLGSRGELSCQEGYHRSALIMSTPCPHQGIFLLE